MSPWLATVWTALAGFLTPGCAAAHAPLSVGDARVAPGSRHDLQFVVPVGEHDPATFVPVTVLHGARPGPVLLFVAGVHGFEFAPILAVQQLADELDPKRLAGSVLFVRVAHVAAFEHRSPYVNPFDRKNLNRSFPGRPNGTQTERIAWVLSSQIIPKADMVFDLHSGDGAEWLAAFVGVYGGNLATDYPRALRAGLAFGFPNLVRYEMQTQQQVDEGRSLNRQAVAQGLPTVLVEVGQNGQRNPADVLAIVTGVKRVLGAFNMLESQQAVSGQRGQQSGSPAIESVAMRCFFGGTASVPTSHAGIWSPRQVGGRAIQRGQLLGAVRGYDGAILETVTAPTDGYALYGLAGPPVVAGESVMTIAKPLVVDGQPTTACPNSPALGTATR